ncbi:MAG: hypothetical protein IPJ37_03320 [Bacteroidales bacterium]|nr:hypothetical protein [Bacteroidales bacterium]
MIKSEKKKANWREKYRYAIINDHTFEEVWRITLTRYNAFLLVSFLVIFIIGTTTCLIAFTNLREFLPGYPDVTMRRNILMSAIRLDSLDRELELRDKYFANLNAIISGNQPAERFARQDTTKNYKAIDFGSSRKDSALRTRVENEERYNLTLGPSSSEAVASLAGLHFFLQ